MFALFYTFRLTYPTVRPSGFCGDTIAREMMGSFSWHSPMASVGSAISPERLILIIFALAFASDKFWRPHPANPGAAVRQPRVIPRPNNISLLRSPVTTAATRVAAEFKDSGSDVKDWVGDLSLARRAVAFHHLLM